MNRWEINNPVNEKEKKIEAFIQKIQWIETIVREKIDSEKTGIIQEYQCNEQNKYKRYQS